MRKPPMITSMITRPEPGKGGRSTEAGECSCTRSTFTESQTRKSAFPIDPKKHHRLRSARKCSDQLEGILNARPTSAGWRLNSSSRLPAHAVSHQL